MTQPPETPVTDDISNHRNVTAIATIRTVKLNNATPLVEALARGTIPPPVVSFEPVFKAEGSL